MLPGRHRFGNKLLFNSQFGGTDPVTDAAAGEAASLPATSFAGWSDVFRR